jgi:hypothetical protein
MPTADGQVLSEYNLERLRAADTATRRIYVREAQEVLGRPWPANPELSPAV